MPKLDKERDVPSSHRFYPSSVQSFEGEPSPIDFAIAIAPQSIGDGLVALRAFSADATIASFTGVVLPYITQYSLQLDPSTHLHDPFFMGKLLHSCDPNCRAELASRSLRSLKAIRPRDFLTIDYEATEDRLFRSFRCHCGVEGCRGTITGRQPGLSTRSSLAAHNVPAQPERYTLISKATVPIESCDDGHLMVWTGLSVGEEIFVYEHRTPRAITATVRIHSSCFTGDVLGSLRCDCGEQFAMSLAAVCRAPWGVLVYLPNHEGRGIGLANKLRAYEFQDAGLDTFAANRELGFDDDLRSYSGAARVLHELGVLEAIVLTRNPFKVEALTSIGIQVREVRPVDCEPHLSNHSYVTRKLEWFSAVTDHLTGQARSSNAACAASQHAQEPWS